MERLITPVEAGGILRVSAGQVRALIAQKQIKAVKVGRGTKVQRYAIKPSELESYIERNTTAPVAKRRRRPAPDMEVIQYV